MEIDLNFCEICDRVLREIERGEVKIGGWSWSCGGGGTLKNVGRSFDEFR
jgi:hypothetical protein